MNGLTPSAVIIEASELKALIDARDPRLVIMDSTFVMPGSAIDPYEVFKDKRIPGAQFFDIEAFSDHTSLLPHMLCDAQDFAAKAGALGIDRDSLIVIYGQSGMIMGPARAWWSFKAYGHPQVLVLNGGLPSWIAADYALESSAPALPPMRSYDGISPRAFYADLEDMRADQTALVLDARPAERFKGAVPEPRAGLRTGHVPGSISAPCSLLVGPDGRFQSRSVLETFFEERGLKPGADVILTCGSGVTACALALGLSHIGFGNWRVYDGSWAEWGQETLDTSVETG